LNLFYYFYYLIYLSANNIAVFADRMYCMKRTCCEKNDFYKIDEAHFNSLYIQNIYNSKKVKFRAKPSRAGCNVQLMRGIQRIFYEQTPQHSDLRHYVHHYIVVHYQNGVTIL
jgi:hypothetical protein